MGHRMPPKVSGHVRDRVVGREETRTLADPRPHRHQTPLLQCPPRTRHFCFRDQSSASGPRAESCPGRSGVFPLSVVLDDTGDRKSTRLNSSHGYISYAVFCLKKKKNRTYAIITTRGRRSL